MRVNDGGGAPWRLYQDRSQDAGMERRTRSERVLYQTDYMDAPRRTPKAQRLLQNWWDGGPPDPPPPVCRSARRLSVLLDVECTGDVDVLTRLRRTALLRHHPDKVGTAINVGAADASLAYIQELNRLWAKFQVYLRKRRPV